MADRHHVLDFGLGRQGLYLLHPDLVRFDHEDHRDAVRLGQGADQPGVHGDFVPLAERRRIAGFTTIAEGAKKNGRDVKV